MPRNRASRCGVLSLLLLCIWGAVPAVAAPLGSTVHPGGVTFRVWAPFVDSVAVRINESAPVPMIKEDGHTDAGDTVWAVDVPGAKAGDRYKYAIACNGNTNDFIDPRGLELTDHTPAAWSVIVDQSTLRPAPFKEPALRELVIYEMHIGSFNANPAQGGRFDFAGAAAKLDYLQKLGINAIQLLPINENAVGFGGGGGRRGRGAATQPATAPASRPAAMAQANGARRATDYDWGYDPSSYFAIKRSYGTPAEFVEFVNAAHAHGIAVIIDVVYNHMSGRTLLRNFGGYTTPQFPNGIYFNDAAHGASPWGPRPDFSRPQVAAFFEDNAAMFLTQLGCDGERWDSVANMRAFSGRGTSAPNPDGIQLMRKSLDQMHASRPGSIFIAEDLRNDPSITKATSQSGIGFDTQWDNITCGAVRKAVTSDAPDVTALAAVIDRKIGDGAFARVIYSEDHDQVGHPPREIRLPALIDPQDPQSAKARQLSNLAAAIILTSPGVPMLFQGQEMLDPRTFTFGVNVPMDWSRAQSQAGTVKLYQDLIALRRNVAGKTAGLQGDQTSVYHTEASARTLAYRRWDKNGDDVIVVINLSATPIADMALGFPRGGRWSARFNSASPAYGVQTGGANIGEVEAAPMAADELQFSGRVSISAQSVLILSQG